jgi:D-sedoheptulose 7-phosphate isomerase
MNSINRYLQEFQDILKRTPLEPIENAIDLLYVTWKNRKKVFILGNGGSASTASHMANDLAKATIVPGKPRMKVIALTDCVSLITAWANDSSYECIFKEQLENLLDEGDLVIGISASGNSPNVLLAMEFARKRGATTLGWTGLSGGRLLEAADHCLQSPTDDVGMIEGAHMVIEHLVSRELLERIKPDTAIGPDNLNTSNTP